MFIEDNIDDSSLLLKIADGNHKAFSTLFYQYRNKIYSYALKICQSEFLAEEIVQDVFLKIWTDRANITHIANIGAYLMVMARNQSLQVLKRIALEAQSNHIRNIDWSETGSPTEDYIDYKETRLVLEQAMSRLPSQQKLVYHMCHLEGMKQHEVASQLSISKLTVKAHLRQAVKTVREVVLANTNLMLFFIIVNQWFKN
jgi:RNA polymerase sigma-70 factor (ECF subfamily)